MNDGYESVYMEKVQPRKADCDCPYSLVIVLRICSWQGSVCCLLLSRIFLTESSRPNTWARLLSTATSTRQESGISAAINQRVTWSVRKEEQIQLLLNNQSWSIQSLEKPTVAISKSSLMLVFQPSASKSSWICSFFPFFFLFMHPQASPKSCICSSLKMHFPAATTH